MRHGHWLAPNERTKIPRWHLCVSVHCYPDDAAPDEYHLNWWNAALLDAEGTDDLHGCKFSGTNPDAFWSTVISLCYKNSTLWVWFGRAAVAIPALRFTALVQAERFKPQFWCWGNPPTIITGTLARRRVKLLCLENWINPTELGGNLCGPRVGAVANHVSKIISFVRDEDLGSLRATTGSQSLQAYRHLCLPGKVGIHNNEHALQLERDCALGQTLHVLKQGKVAGPVYCVDVNAMYPYVMGNYPYPRKLLWCCGEMAEHELRQKQATALIIARVSGRDTNGSYLVKRNDHCEWTSELKNDTLCGPDLDRALWGNAISEVHAVAAYEGAGVFVKWSEWALALRRRYSTAERAALRPLAKHLTNALWGKFASGKGRWVRWRDAPSDARAYGYWYFHDEGEASIRCRTIAGITDRWEDDDEPYNSFPALSAFTAAYARYFLSGLCAIVGWENIHYVAADSLHVTKEGYKRLGRSRLVNQHLPGKLKLESVHKETFYHAANVYAKDNFWTVAGRPVDAEQTGPATWSWRAVQDLSAAIMAAPMGRVQTQRRVLSLG